MSHIERRGFCNRCGLCEPLNSPHVVSAPGKQRGEADATDHVLVAQLAAGMPRAVVLGLWQQDQPGFTAQELDHYLNFPERPEQVGKETNAQCNYSFVIVHDDGAETLLPPKEAVDRKWQYPIYDPSLPIVLNNHLYNGV
mgnify:CR=1 FL=1